MKSAGWPTGATLAQTTKMIDEKRVPISASFSNLTKPGFQRYGPLEYLSDPQRGSLNSMTTSCKIPVIGRDRTCCQPNTPYPQVLSDLTMSGATIKV